MSLIAKRAGGLAARIRDGLRRRPTFALSGLAALLLVVRVFEPGRIGWRLIWSGSLIFAVILTIVTALLLLAYFRGASRQQSKDVELGALALVATLAWVQLLGGLDAELYPLVYLVTGLMVGFAGMGASLILIGLVGGVELLSALLYGDLMVRIGSIGIHLGLMWLFSITLGTFFYLERRKVRAAETILERMSAKPRKKTGDAPTPTTGPDQSSKPDQEIETEQFGLDEMLFDLLNLLGQAIGARAVLLALLDRRRQNLVISQSTAQEAEMKSEFALADLDPALAVGLTDGRHALVSYPKQKARPAPYDETGPAVRSVVSAPVQAGGRTLGLVLADTIGERLLERREARLVVAAAGLVGGFIQRAARVDRLKAQSRLWPQLSEYVRLLDEKTEEPADLLCRLSLELTEADSGLVCVLQDNRLKVVAGQGQEEHVGKDFGLGEGLAGRVCLDGDNLILPDFKKWQKNAAKAERLPVLGEAGEIKDLHGLILIPLRLKDSALGALVCIYEEADRAAGHCLPLLALIGSLAVEELASRQRLDRLAAGDDPEISWPFDRRGLVRAADHLLSDAAGDGSTVCLFLISQKETGDRGSDLVERIRQLPKKLLGGACLARLSVNLVGLLCPRADALWAGLVFNALRAKSPEKMAGGVAVFPGGGVEFKTLMKNASSALDRALADNGDKVYLWTSETLQNL